VKLTLPQAHSRSEDLGDVSSLLQDAIYTVRKFSSPISTSALQVYHSVLVFMPDCPLFKRASQSVVPIARMITDRGSTWNQSVDQSAIVLEGHTDEILFVAFSTDGSCILSCSWDGTARVWDASSGEQKIIFTGHEKTAIAAAFSLDEQTVTTVDQAGNVHTRDVSTGLTTGKARITFVGDIRCLAYSRDGARIISCSESTTFFIDVATHQLLRVLHLSPLRTGSVNCLKLSADGSRLYRQYSVEKEGYTREGYHLSQGHVEIWDICDETDLVHRADIGPMYRNSTLAFSADGQRAAFVNDEDDLEMVEFLQDGSTCRSTVNTWDMRETFCNIAVSSSARALVIAPSFNGEDILLVDMSSRPIAMPPQLVTLGQYPGMINCMAFSPDDARVALGSTEGLISIWNTESGRPYPSSSPCASNSRASVVKTRLSRDGLQVICTYSNGLIEINSTTTGSFVTSFHPWRTGTLPNHFLPWLCLTISPDSLRLALFNLNNSIRDGVYIWDLQAGSILVSSQSIPQQGHPVWSLDGSRCAVTVVGCRIHVLDASDGSVKADLGFPDPLEIGKEIRPHHAEFSSDGRHLLFIFREIQTDSRTENNSWTQHTCLWSTVWSIDTWMLHSVIVSCGLRVDTKQVFVPDCDEVSGFSPKGTHLVSYQPQAKLLHLRGIDDEGGIFYLVCEGNDTQIQEVMWSRDGSKVALIDSGEVLVWSTACSTTSCHLKIIFRLDLPWIPPNANHIYCLVKFSADSLRIVIPTSEDGKYSHFPLPTQPGLVTENRSVDIIVIRNSGWLLCSRADRADLVPLLWVPLERRWGEVDDVAVVGNKVAFPSVYSDSVTVLEFPSLQDLYCLFEPDHDS
jgi:WD40 repeat protein